MITLQASQIRSRAVLSAVRPWHHMGWYVVIPWLLVVMVLAQLPTVAYAQEQLYVPMVAMNRGPVEGSGDTPVACALGAEETAVLTKMASHPDQRRHSLTCDPLLAAVARARAEDMAGRDYFSHTNPDGEGPNFLVEKAGYVLPEWYDHSRDANNLESIAAGFETPNDAWDAWMESRGHRTHLLALESFYAEQVMVGIGYAYGPESRFKQYWVVITAPLLPVTDAFVSPLTVP
jgi:hypothetical protein